jgi:hypothetical protein
MYASIHQGRGSEALRYRNVCKLCTGKYSFFTLVPIKMTVSYCYCLALNELQLILSDKYHTLLCTCFEPPGPRCLVQLCSFYNNTLLCWAPWLCLQCTFLNERNRIYDIYLNNYYDT